MCKSKMVMCQCICVEVVQGILELNHEIQNDSN